MYMQRSAHIAVGAVVHIADSHAVRHAHKAHVPVVCKTSPSKLRLRPRIQTALSASTMTLATAHSVHTPLVIHMQGHCAYPLYPWRARTHTHSLAV